MKKKHYRDSTFGMFKQDYDKIYPPLPLSLDKR